MADNRDAQEMFEYLQGIVNALPYMVNDLLVPAVQLSTDVPATVKRLEDLERQASDFKAAFALFAEGLNNA